jgi:hypothetical protein
MGIVRQGWMTIGRQHSMRTSPSAAVAKSAVAGEGLGTVRGSRRQVAWHPERSPVVLDPGSSLLLGGTGQGRSLGWRVP